MDGPKFRVVSPDLDDTENRELHYATAELNEVSYMRWDKFVYKTIVLLVAAAAGFFAGQTFRIIDDPAPVVIQQEQSPPPAQPNPPDDLPPGEDVELHPVFPERVGTPPDGDPFNIRRYNEDDQWDFYLY